MDEVTHTGYPEWNIISGAADEEIQEMEFNRLVAMRREKLAELSRQVGLETLILYDVSKVNLVVTQPTLKSPRERVLEFLADGCTHTVKDVCIHLHQVEYFTEKKRLLMKATSMLLMRLSNKRQNLVHQERGKTGCIYSILIEGLKRLHYYQAQRAKTDRKRELRRQMKKIWKLLNEEFVPGIMQLWNFNTEVTKKLGGETGETLRNVYAKNTESLMRTIVEGQRVPVEDDEDDFDSRVDAFIQSILSLQQVARGEVLMSEVLGLSQQHQKPLKELIHEKDLELQALNARWRVLRK